MSLQKITYQMHPDTRKMLHGRYADLAQMILWANTTVGVVFKKQLKLEVSQFAHQELRRTNGTSIG